MAGVPVDESDGTIDCQRHGTADVLVIAGLSVRLAAAVGIGEDPALGENRRRVPGQKDDAGGGGVALARLGIAPDEAAQGNPGEKVAVGQLFRPSALSRGNEAARHGLVEVLPGDPRQRLGLEGGGRLDGLPGDLVLVAGGSDPEPLLEEFHQCGADFLLQLDDIAEPLVLETVGLQLLQEGLGALFALHGAIAFDEGQDGQFPILGTAVFGVGDGNLVDAGPVLDRNDEHIDLASVEGLQTSFQGLVGRGRLAFVKQRRAMGRQERIGVQ